MMYSKTLRDAVESCQQKKKRRLDLQRANYKHHNELAKRIVANYFRSADHYFDEEEHNEFDLNDSINTMQNNLNQPNNFITMQDDQDLRDTNNISPCTSQRNIEENKLASNCIVNYFDMDNVEATEGVNVESEEDTDDENGNKLTQHHKILLHEYTNISLQDASIEFLQLIRRSQISKINANQILLFIKRLLPCPNTAPSNMTNLLNYLNIFNYFTTRKICILCRKDLKHYQAKCNDCLMAECKHVAHILDTDILSLLTCVVSRLADQIQKYKDSFSNNTYQQPYDIPFAKQYQQLLIKYPEQNLLSLILHVDGASLVKSTKLKLWLFTASIVELPPNIRMKRQNMILISMYIGYTEPDVKLWLASSLTTINNFKKKGVHSKEAHKRQYRYCLQIQQRTQNTFLINGENAEKTSSNIFGHLGVSVLQDIIDIPLPSSVLIDYAHVTLLRHFRDVLRTISSSLSPAIRETIDVSLRTQQFPHTFGRKLRGIDELSYIKAVELRNLLLYAFLPNFIHYLTVNQIGFLSLLVLGIRLIHGDKILGDNTSVLANDLLITYYRDNEKYFQNHLNFVLHLHQHLGSLYDQHGPLCSINTLAYEDFIGYVSKNRNGTVFHHDLLAYYYNIDVYLRNSVQEKNEISDGLFDSFLLGSSDDLYNVLIKYHAKKCSCNAVQNCTKYYRRCMLRRRIYHSMKYLKKKKTISYFIQFGSAASEFNFGKILFFFSLQGQALALIQHFVYYQRYSTYFKSSCYYDIIKKPIDLYYFVLKETNTYAVIDVHDIITYVIPFKNSEDTSTVVVTPIHFTYEHN
ncbi:unnamed protein product [Rotaria magnacalcarata]|uniref:Uncharacterized protein n=2 Tax=Rotaria magnacalcarata TaxID=392030 RepID=A0A815WP67_9BILA|nr:unnamed protein product [Rotaria magnacalcarata]CAF3915018.1 unnamed protein product [Rotaria magnacalcarata]CAF3940072.1 unnamed protein product [Rotaria magnacalcarata]